MKFSCAISWVKWLSSEKTNSIEQSPSREAKSHSASQEISCLLWKTNVHYHVHKSPQTWHIRHHKKQKIISMSLKQGKRNLIKAIVASPFWELQLLVQQVPYRQEYVPQDILLNTIRHVTKKNTENVNKICPTGSTSC